MSDAAKGDPLDDFPQLRAPAGRTTISAKEMARLLGVSWRHVLDLIAAGDITMLDLKGSGASRAMPRIPVEAYHNFVRSRLIKGWDGNPKPKLRNLELLFH